MSFVFFFISRLLVIAYFLRYHPCFKEIQMNSPTEILITGEIFHGNLDHRWTRFPWPRQYLSTVHLNFSEAWMITHAGNKSTALLNWYFSKNYLKFVLINYSYSVQLQKESICFLVTINSRDNMTLIELNRRL